MSTPVTNFAKGTLTAGYDETATSVAMLTGHGSRFAATFPYPLTWWNATDYPDPSDDPNREIVTVSLRTGDTFTIVRGAEGTTATVKNLAGKTYKMIGGITKKMYEDILDLSLSESFRNLTLQTHPDSDVAHKKVRLVHADAIVMNDGQEIADWDNIDADITASGIGGVDTGAEQASTLYEVHAMYNGTLKKLQLKKAKYYSQDEDSSTGEDATQGLRSAVDNSTVKVSQGFKVDTAGKNEFNDVKLIKVGAPVGNFWFTIETSSGGVPSGTVLATSDKYDAARLRTTADWVRILFRVAATLSAVTQYHLVLQGDFAVSATNYIGWRMDGSAGTYANGSKALFDSDTSTWTNDTDDDLHFKAYITQDDTPLVENGYTQHALIGYVFNNGSSNFKHFHQHGRTVFCGYDDNWQVGAFTTSSSFLVSLFTFLPPKTVSVSLLFYNATAAGLVLGDLKATDLDNSASPITETVGTTRAGVSAGVVTPAGPIVVQYQGIMLCVSAGTGNVYIQEFTW